MEFETNLEYARALDKADPLANYRSQFFMPKMPDGKNVYYFSGNSLGLQPKCTKEYVCSELDDWANLGVKGHTKAKLPWVPYHEFVTEELASIVGAKASEVVAMNSLTTNLHLMMISFYRPTAERHKIIIEAGAFPSDRYAMWSQLHLHGYPPEDLIELTPRPGEATLRTEDILSVIEEQGQSVALVMLPGVQYLTGQAFEMEKITACGHQQGCIVGFDLAHAVGNLLLKLHDWQVDFAVWCNYKYLNAGPGSIGGCYVHERHVNSPTVPRLEGWWGHNKDTRFKMPREFDAIPTVEAWQLSNPPIFQLAVLRASLGIFSEVGMQALRNKSEQLTGYLEYLLQHFLADKVKITTPTDPQQRGCQLSLNIINGRADMTPILAANGIICDFRYPDAVRVAPVPLYNRFEEVFHFVQVMQQEVKA